jgi:hypothetical protein
VSRFEAFTACPKCGHMDHHGLRAPLPKPEPGPVRVASDRIGRLFEVVRWDGMTGPDESMYEVIRNCTACQHEWGQT